MLNAAFMDALDSDAERLIRINHTLTLIEERRRAEHPHWLRSIPLLVIRPSVDLRSSGGRSIQQVAGDAPVSHARDRRLAGTRGGLRELPRVRSELHAAAHRDRA